MLSDSCHDLCYTFGLYGDREEFHYANQLDLLTASEARHAIKEFRESLKWYSKEPFDYETSVIEKLRLALSLYSKGILPVGHLIAVAESARIFYDSCSDEVDVLLGRILKIMESPRDTNGVHMALESFNAFVKVKPVPVTNVPKAMPLAKVIPIFGN